jgi:NAD(P)-dependent dehydrogenase (short-subunit alcohol dehydrogenase family)
LKKYPVPMTRKGKPRDRVEPLGPEKAYVMQLNECIVLVTGANRGIGRALVERFLGSGATCVATARSEETGARLVAELQRYGDRAFVEHVDISDETQVRALRDRVGERLRRVDILVNNAGILLEEDRHTGPDHLPLDVLRRTLDTNLIGTVAMCSAFIPLIPKGGRIINVSSTMGQLEGGLETYATAYAISKTALNAYTSALAAALESRKIFVDAMHPGWVKTAMGGPGAQITPEVATETAFFLATRPEGETGLFWRRNNVIPW